MPIFREEVIAFVDEFSEFGALTKAALLPTALDSNNLKELVTQQDYLYHDDIILNDDKSISRTNVDTSRDVIQTHTIANPNDKELLFWCDFTRGGNNSNIDSKLFELFGSTTDSIYLATGTYSSGTLRTKATLNNSTAYTSYNGGSRLNRAIYMLHYVVNQGRWDIYHNGSIVASTAGRAINPFDSDVTIKLGIGSNNDKFYASALLVDDSFSAESISQISSDPYTVFQVELTPLIHNAVVVNSESTVVSSFVSTEQLKKLFGHNTEQVTNSQTLNIAQNLTYSQLTTEQTVESSFINILSANLAQASSSEQSVVSDSLSLSQLQQLTPGITEQLVQASHIDVVLESSLSGADTEQNVTSTSVNILSGTALTTFSTEQAVESLNLTLSKIRGLSPNDTEQAIHSSVATLENGAVYVLTNSECVVESATVDLMVVRQWFASHSEQTIESSMVSAIALQELTVSNSAQFVESAFYRQLEAMPAIDLDNIKIISLTPRFLIKSHSPKFKFH